MRVAINPKHWKGTDILMKTLKKISLFMMLILSVAMVLPTNTDAAEKKVGKASISAKTKDSTVTLTIKKTENAEGYEIYVKAPGEKKYQKVETLSKDGSQERTYAYTAKKDGNHLFKVRGYRKENGKTKYGNYSKSVKVKIQTQKDKKDSGEVSKSSEVNKNNSKNNDKDDQKSESRTVYITKTGKCYHYSSKCGNGKYEPIDLETAKKNYSPCKKCVGV